MENYNFNYNNLIDNKNNYLLNSFQSKNNSISPNQSIDFTKNSNQFIFNPNAKQIKKDSNLQPKSIYDKYAPVQISIPKLDNLVNLRQYAFQLKQNVNMNNGYLNNLFETIENQKSGFIFQFNDLDEIKNNLKIRVSNIKGDSINEGTEFTQNNKNSMEKFTKTTNQIKYANFDVSSFGKFNKKDLNPDLLKQISLNKEILLRSIKLSQVNSKFEDWYNKTYLFNKNESINLNNTSILNSLMNNLDNSNKKIPENDIDNDFSLFGLTEEEVQINTNFNFKVQPNKKINDNDYIIAQKYYLVDEFKRIINDYDISNEQCVYYMSLYMKNDHDFYPACVEYFKAKYNQEKLKLVFKITGLEDKTILFNYYDKTDELIAEAFKLKSDFNNDGMPNFYLSSGEKLEIDGGYEYIGCYLLENGSVLIIN